MAVEATQSVVTQQDSTQNEIAATTTGNVGGWYAGAYLATAASATIMNNSIKALNEANAEIQLSNKITQALNGIDASTLKSREEGLSNSSIKGIEGFGLKANAEYLSYQQDKVEKLMKKYKKQAKKAGTYKKDMEISGIAVGVGMALGGLGVIASGVCCAVFGAQAASHGKKAKRALNHAIKAQQSIDSGMQSVKNKLHKGSANKGATEVSLDNAKNNIHSIFNFFKG